VSSFPNDTLVKTSGLVLRGLKLCTEKPCPLRNEIMTSPDFWVILQTLAVNPESAPAVFEILESGTSAIMADNYEAALSLLNEFASMASVGAVAEQKNDRKQGRKGARPVKQEKPRYVLDCLYWESRLLTKSSENAVVERGVKAVNSIYGMTSRIPNLMKQSHLESKEGEHPPLFHQPSITILTLKQHGQPTGCPSSKHSQRSAPTRAAKCATWHLARCSARCSPPI
jgi:brefeldin A-resistance guanine nucleotide exchange factor 1